MRTTVLSMAISVLIAQSAIAENCCTPSRCEQPSCCDTGCCCQSACVPKGCKLVCEMKKVKKECWVVECEDFCTTLPNCHCKKCCGTCGGCQTGGCCETGCGGCDPCADMRKCLVPPKCGMVRCRKKLVKKTIECEVPVYKCVPVCRGCGCCDACSAGEVEVTGEVEVPQAPLPAAPLPPAL